MGNRRSELGSGRDSSDSDLELFREKLLDHTDEEDAVSGNDIENSSNATTGPIKVVVKQDGIGRTGGVVISIVAGLALGLGVMAVVLMGMRDRDRDERVDKLEKENRLTQYYLLDPHSRTPDELAAWVKFNKEHEVK